MRIKPIKNEADYRAALDEIERLFDAVPGTEEAEHLEVLMILVEAYEEEHYNIPPPDPIEAIRYHMESRGLSRADLERYIGTRARVSEVLNKKRRLSINMMRRLQAGLGIPAEVLIQPYDLVSDAPEPDEDVMAPLDSRTPYGMPHVATAESISTEFWADTAGEIYRCFIAQREHRDVLSKEWTLKVKSVPVAESEPQEFDMQSTSAADKQSSVPSPDTDPAHIIPCDPWPSRPRWNWLH